MTDPQAKSIKEWRDRCFKLYWKLRAAQGRIEKLEVANLAQSCIKVDDQMRIEKLEAALREIDKIAISHTKGGIGQAQLIARKALEGKDE